MYKLSNSIIHRIWKDQKIPIEHKNSSKLLANTSSISAQAKMLIQIALKPPQKPIMVNDLRKLIYAKLGEEISYYETRKLINDELKYSFK